MAMSETESHTTLWSDAAPLFCLIRTVESRFLEPSGETQIGSRNREFEKSKVASDYA